MKKLFLYILAGIIILVVIPIYIITSMNSGSEVDVNSKELKNYAPKFFVEVAKITYPENSEIKHISPTSS
jgi:ABC-type lipoprotein release transport system permease subunit